jgi:TonB family protein
MGVDDYNQGFSTKSFKDSILKPLPVYVSLILHLLFLLFIITVTKKSIVKAKQPVEIGLTGSTEKTQPQIKIKTGVTFKKSYSSPVISKIEQKPVTIGAVGKNNVKADRSDVESGTGQAGSPGGSPNAGNGNTVSDFYYVAVDQMPVPVGGMQSITARMNLQGPVSGKASIYLEAFIDENGNVNRCVLIKGIGNKLDDLALKVVKKTKFQPGVLNGKRVKVQLYISIPIPGN